MEKKSVFFIILAIVLALFIAITAVWAITELPNLIPAPKATTKTEPFSGTVNGYEGLSMTAEPGSAHSTGVTLVIRNNTGMDLSSGHSYGISVQKLQDGQWYPMLRRTDKRAVNMVPSIHLTYAADESPYRKGISWEAFIGRLEPGHYRVVWSFSVHENLDSSPIDTVLLAAEFDVE